MLDRSLSNGRGLTLSASKSERSVVINQKMILNAGGISNGMEVIHSRNIALSRGTNSAIIKSRMKKVSIHVEDNYFNKEGSIKIGRSEGKIAEAKEDEFRRW